MVAFNRYNLYKADQSFFKSSVRPKMGANYLFDGRLYCQIKKDTELVYVDINYKLNVKLLSWTTNSIDVEIDIQDISISEEYMIYASDGKMLLDRLFALENKTLYLRVNNTGRVVKIFNLSELKEALSLTNISETNLLSLIETNPIIAAFISGQIETSVKSEKVFNSLIRPNLFITSKLQIKEKRDIFLNSSEISISASALKDSCEFSSLITANKGAGKILPYSITFTTEEKMDDNNNSFISVGIESIVSKKEIGLMTKLRGSIYKGVSLIFL